MRKVLGVAPSAVNDEVTKGYVDGTVVTKTQNYTANNRDVVLADASGGGFTVIVPRTAGSYVTVKKVDSSTNIVTVVPSFGLIDGDANATLVTAEAGAIFVGDGTNVQIAGSNPANRTTYPITTTATPGAVPLRDSSGRTQMVDPAAAADVATKNYVDTGSPANPSVKWHYVGDYNEPAYLNGWSAYAAVVFTSVRFRRDGQGKIHLNGWTTNTSTTSTSPIFTLPVGYRPDLSLIFNVLCGGGIAQLRVDPNGSVYVNGYGTSGSVPINLDQVHFFASDSGITWTYVGATGAPAYANSWTSYGTADANFPGARYYIDADGWIHLGGVARAGTGGSIIFTLPTAPAINGSTQWDQPSGGNAPARVDIQTTGAVQHVSYETNGVNSFLSLEGMVVPSRAKLKYVVGSGEYANSWVTYGAGACTPAWGMDAQGVVHWYGLIKSGTGNTPIFAATVPVHLRPSFAATAIVSSNNWSARLAIAYDHNMYVQTYFGSAGPTFVSLCGLSYQGAEGGFLG